MKAIIYTKYGGPEVLRLKEVAIPHYRENEVLVKIVATAVNSGDWRLRSANPFLIRLFSGLIKPKFNILGSAFSGVVEKAGKEVVGFKVGDAVFGSSHISFGTYAEYISFPQDGSIALKPDNILHGEAATIPFGASTSLYWLKKANIKTGQKVLIVGASGAVGSAAVQLARYFGAEVTAVCSRGNFDLVRSLGAESVIDYASEDFTKNGIQYDVIFDTVRKVQYSKALKSLRKDGTMILSAAGGTEMLRAAYTSAISDKKVLTGIIKINGQDMIFLKDLITAGILNAVVDRVYPLNQIAEAHAYVEKGHKKGNVAITI